MTTESQRVAQIVCRKLCVESGKKRESGFNGRVRRIHGISWRWANRYEQGGFGRLQCREQVEIRHYCRADVSSIGRRLGHII